MPAYQIPFAPASRYQDPRAGTIAALIQQGAQNQAATVQRGGEIAGQLYSNLGNIAQGTIGQIVQQRQQAPILAQEAQLRQAQIADVQAQAAQRRAAEGDQRAIDTASQSGGLSLEAITKNLADTGHGHLIPTVTKSWNDAETAKATLQESRAKAQNAEADYFGALAAGVKPFLSGEDGGLGAVQLAVQHAKQAGFADADQILAQIQANPQQLPQMIDSLIAQSPTQQKLLGEAADRSLKTQQEQRAIQTAQTSAANIAADNARANQAETRAAAAQAETVRHNRATEAQAQASAAVSGAPLDVTSDVRTTLSGQKYIDLGDYQTPKERSEASAKAKQLGVPAVQKEVGMSLQAGDTARQNIAAMMAQIETKLPKDAQGRLIGGPQNKLKQYFQSDTDLAAFNSWRAGAIQAVQALVERGMGFRLNQAEINMIMQNDMPQITDTVQTARQRTANVLKLLDNKEKAALTKDRSALTPAAPTTVPAVGSTFQGGTVLKVEKVK